MSAIKKVFLPKWQKKFIPPFFFLMWVFITYKNFFSTGKGEMSILEYLFMSLVFIGVGSVVWFMASGKLPAYIIKEETTEDSEIK